MSVVLRGEEAFLAVCHCILVVVFFCYYLVRGLSPLPMLGLLGAATTQILSQVVISFYDHATLKASTVFGSKKSSVPDCPAFNLNAMDPTVENENVIDDCNTSLLRIIAEHAASENAVHFKHLMTYFAWDMIGATTTGRPLGFMTTDDHTRPLQELRKWKLYAIIYGTYFVFRPWIASIYHKVGFVNACRFLQQTLYKQPVAISPEKGRSRTLRNTLLGQSDHKADYQDKQKSKNGKTNRSEFSNSDTRTKPSFWTVFAALSGEGNVLDQNDSLTTAMALMLADSDPIIGHILCTLSHLAEDPGSVIRLRKELVASKKASSQPPRVDELLDLEYDLPFLNAVLLESQRLDASADRDDHVSSVNYLAAERCKRHWSQRSSYRSSSSTTSEHTSSHRALHCSTTARVSPSCSSLLSNRLRPQSVSSSSSETTWNGEEREDPLTFMRQLIGDPATKTLFFTARGPIESLDARLVHFGVLETDPVLDRNARTRFNNIIRDLFIGKLETTTDADKCIVIQATGTGTGYHRDQSRGRGNRYHKNDYNRRGGRNNGSNRENVRGRGYQGRQQQGNERNYTSIRGQTHRPSTSTATNSANIPTPPASGISTNEPTMNPTAANFSTAPPNTADADPSAHESRVAKWKNFATTTTTQPAAHPGENSEKKEIVYAKFKTTYKKTVRDNDNWLAGGNRKIISLSKPEDQTAADAADAAQKKAAEIKGRASRQPFVEDE